MQRVQVPQDTGDVDSSFTSSDIVYIALLEQIRNRIDMHKDNVSAIVERMSSKNNEMAKMIVDLRTELNVKRSAYTAVATRLGFSESPDTTADMICKRIDALKSSIAERDHALSMLAAREKEFLASERNYLEILTSIAANIAEQRKKISVGIVDRHRRYCAEKQDLMKQIAWLTARHEETIQSTTYKLGKKIVETARNPFKLFAWPLWGWRLIHRLLARRRISIRGDQ